MITAFELSVLHTFYLPGDDEPRTVVARDYEYETVFITDEYGACHELHPDEAIQLA